MEKRTWKYMGCNIERLFPSGMYYALTSQGSIRADTLAGAKEMIRKTEKTSKRK